DRREAHDPVRAVVLDGVGVGGGNDFGRLFPADAHEAAVATLLGVSGTLLGILDDRGPGGDWRQGGARLAPQPQQARAGERVLHAVAGIEVPAVGGAARATARLVVGQVGPGARIVGLLRLPGDDAALDVDLPRAGAGAVHPVGGADHLVVLPAGAVALLPAAILGSHHAVSVGELVHVLAEEGQPVE